MPKNKKPQGGRPAKNFEPRYGATTSYQDRKRRPGESSAGKAGSKSPGHRGYRSADEGQAPKRRWTAQEKVARDESRGIRTRGASERAGRDDRPRRDDRGFDRPRYEDRGYDRARRDDRGYERGSDRPRRDDRGFERGSDRPRRDDRGFERGSDRSRRDDRGYERARRDDRGFERRSDRPRRDDRGYERARRDDRGFERRSDRPRRDDRGYERDRRADRAHTASAPVRDAAREQHVDVVHERLQAEAVRADHVADVTFADLGLGQNIVTRLTELGAEKPFPIQAATVAPILEGRDVLARGRTGSGKTIAFGAPLVESVLRSQAGKRREFGRSPRALIMAPTRELALQIDRTVQTLARSVGLFTTQIYGGVPQARQVGALKKGVDIVIGTPGRIEDLERQGKLDLSQVQIAVLDEADHMCELGFLEPVQRILRLTAESSQKLLFSATLDREVAALVDEFLVKPAVYEVAGEDQDSGTIEHRVLVVDHRDKPEILRSLVDREGKTLVFARTRAYTEMLAEQFEDAGIAALALHGDLNQSKRTRNLEKLTSGRVKVLVATDVAARGIHVDDIDLVIQADAPDEYKTYLHRSGRTGRAGRQGTVVTLVPRQRRRRMSELLDRAEIDAPFDDVRPDDDLLEEISGRQLADVTS
ncbi:DEAD/DEAH box helicase [Microbacterium xanthum]|uniref:DEAD/DEAH box helicase n=1 Tax=Microbacterium xanthum TaxID=3079794 RepID=UPI002AD2E41A|nr:DEAD/DEAH box helicase [Microbacterium sp. KSW-48]MDZ8171441.1 DEAD/DEAH box helicase [Microbacterium sp. KSW-48]